MLAIDTSTLTASVALVVDDALVGELVARVPANHSDVVLPMIEELLMQAGVRLAQLDTIAVGLGPGSFTGVRVGVATAKGLSVATGRPLVGVSSLQALAAGAVGAQGPVVAALDARRGEIYLAVFQLGSEQMPTLLAATNGGAEAMGRLARAASGPGELLALGDLDDAAWDLVAAGAGGQLRRAPRVIGTPSARFVASEAAADRGIPDTHGALEPVYVRPSDAKPASS